MLFTTTNSMGKTRSRFVSIFSSRPTLTPFQITFARKWHVVLSCSRILYHILLFLIDITWVRAPEWVHLLSVWLPQALQMIAGQDFKFRSSAKRLSVLQITPIPWICHQVDQHSDQSTMLRLELEHQSMTEYDLCKESHDARRWSWTNCVTSLLNLYTYSDCLSCVSTSLSVGKDKDIISSIILVLKLIQVVWTVNSDRWPRRLR
jgi:hypothetical protein